MNKNQENYKKALDQITPSEELKQKTFRKATIKQQVKKPVFIKYLAACAVFAICLSGSAVYLKHKKPLTKKDQTTQTQVVAQKMNDLPRFENMEQVREALKENNNRSYEEKMLQNEVAMEDTIASSTTKEEARDYSETNVQVKGVDEADIVKTDGKYIYYVTKEKVYIIDSENLEIKSKMDYDTKNIYYPSELYINQNKMIVLGITYQDNQEPEDTVTSEAFTDCIYPRYYRNSQTKVIVYDISDKSNPKEDRTIIIDGEYNTSRMIEDNIYFVSSKDAYYYDLAKIEDDEIMPLIKDTANEDRKLKCTDIAYFEGTENKSFMTVAGFNINNKEKINTESFFGASENVYANKNNLYITQSEHKYVLGQEKTTSKIYKFNLEQTAINLQAQTEIKGYLNNQFSMDEYEGNLRVATTKGYDEKSNNQLYILDENLNEIGKIEDLAKGEKIYSVRFVGKIGYIVTFEQIDPLFVIDLSDPTNPEVKGELKIPGYSSYLHPYDETHIIGIGYNTKSNGYGGVVNDNMKMSMFDVSDVTNPKEMFSIDIGSGYTYSEVMYNHKALFYSKDKNLIGFPIETSGNSKKYYYNSSFRIYKIDLEKGFEEYGKIEANNDDEKKYIDSMKRAIYISDILYVLSDENIVTYNLNTLEKQKELEL